MEATVGFLVTPIEHGMTGGGSGGSGLWKQRNQYVISIRSINIQSVM